MSPITLIERAHRALEEVQDEPLRTQREAEMLLEEPEAGDEVRVVALWALARALLELDDVNQAAAALDEAIVLAEAFGDETMLANIRVSASVCYFSQGHSERAFAELDQAEAELTGHLLGRAIMQRALLEHRQGHHRSALVLFNESSPLLVLGDDRVGEARLLANRSALHSYLGNWREAESDLQRLTLLARALDQRVIEAVAVHNLAFLHGRLGDIPSSLDGFELAREAYAGAGSPARVIAALDADIVEVLHAAGLSAEAAVVAGETVAHCVEAGNTAAEAEARLRLAEALLAVGDRARALEESHLARVSFEADGRTAWAALAESVELMAMLDIAVWKQDLEAFKHWWDRSMAVAGVLADQDWYRQAARLRVDTARLAYDLGRRDLVLASLRDAADLRDATPPELRILAWHARALEGAVRSGSAEALAAVEAGLEVVREHRESFGSTELRALASAQGMALAELGLQLALETEDAFSVLLWAERLKAGALDLAPVRPPADDALTLALADVRNLEAQLREETASGTVDDSLRDRVRESEQAVSQILRRVSGEDSSGKILSSQNLSDLLDLARDNVVVEFLVSAGQLWSVTVRDNEPHVRCLGDVDLVDVELDNLLFALRRAARGPTSQASADAIRSSLERSVAALDEVLLATVDVDTHSPIVIIPTGRLHELPWNALPTLRGRAAVVSPSLRLWCRAPRDGEQSARDVLLMAGPGLNAAEAEVAEVAAIYAASQKPPVVFARTGPDATPATALEFMERVDLAHLAAHGTFREESPLFSTIHLFGASLTVHDLETLVTAPRVVVLPACSAGRSRTHFGDELLGTTGALLSLGVEALIAPVIEVPDEATRACMAALHHKLAAGSSPSTALDEVAGEVANDDDLRAVSAGLAFVCFGTR